MPVLRFILLLILVFALSSCGKADVAIVKPPRVPIYVCSNGASPRGSDCEGKFNAGRLLGLTLNAGERLAHDHGHTVRRVIPAEGIELDYRSGRIDIECTSTSPDCIIVRLVRTG